MSQSQPHELRPYQREGVGFLVTTPRALLAFDTRLGKSLVALRAAEQVGARRILILSPAIGRLSWETEIRKAGGALPWVIGTGRSTPRVSAQLAASDDLIFVLAYDALSRAETGWALTLAARRRWDVMILDECQYLKSTGANRTKAVYRDILPNVDRVWLLSGTPTPNHAGELYPHYRALWPDNPPLSRFEFEDEYCRVQVTPFGRRISGSRNQDKLRAKLAPYVLRKRKHEVIQDLPRMAHQLVPLDIPTPRTTPPELVSDAALDALLARPVSIKGGSVAHALGLDKVAGAVAWVREQLDHDLVRKIVLFAWHKDVLTALMTGLLDHEPVRIDGDTSEADRATAIRRFQDPRDNCRVFVGQIRSCGTAICLDAADDVAFVEPSWVPMDNYQAASRVENVGRRKAVTVHWLCAPRSLDERIMQIMRTKTQQLSALWD